ncbi:MAG TPA: peptidoglycan editing factor PgeF [Blastocatellia bacterium]|nr:peptidoglycan editing factor PgeF [Blastocatellia bacterium]
MNHFTLRQNNGLTYLVCEPIEQLGFINAFSTRQTTESNEFTLGHFSAERQAQIMANRDRFKAAVGAPDATLVTAKQIHSADVRLIADHEDAQSEPQPGDALTANLSNLLLGIQTADCMPIIIVDTRTRAFAGIHAGWRGTFQEIAARTIERMQQAYNSRPADLHAALGPVICAENFEVGSEVLEQFRSKFRYADELISNEQSNGKGHIDLNRCNAQQLIDTGLRAENIYDSALCTVARNDLFFSYRKERGHERYVGRLMSVVGKKD